MKRSQDVERPRIFNLMATHPTLFLVAFPLACIVLIGIGWTRDGIIEDQVTNIWIPTKGEFAKDLKYAADLGAAESLGAASFAAMAISRDGGNLFTADRLEEIVLRMQQTEATTIEHKGNTYKWEDVCASAGGFPYQFPCARLTPLDLFQEASWFFNYTDERSDPNIPAERENLYRRTWYNDLIRKKLVKPRIPRFGVLTELCSTECGAVLNYRLNPTSAGYSPFSLFADIGNLEMSDTCRICIETRFEGTIKTLFEAARPSFQVLALELQRFAANTNDTAAIAKAGDLAQKAGQIAASITTQSMEEFYFYYVTRGAYAALGAPRYQAGFQNPDLMQAIGFCGQQADAFGLTCPGAAEVTLEDAEAAMLRHADSDFSSVSTAGSPLPFWDTADGTGELFKGNSPVGGSGVDMSADIRSLFAYLNVTLYGQEGWSPLYGATGFADPTSPLFTATVEKNPIFSWFVAGLEDAPATTSCGNGMLPGTNTGVPQVDGALGGLAGAVTARWCTDYSIPNTNYAGDAQPYSRQHFARMWYDLLIDSSSFLGLEEGVDDPYTWTLGQGCGYSLRGERDVYRNMTDEMILQSASRELYYIDEGESVGAISPVLLMGDASTKSGNFPVYSADDPLTKVGVMQSLYFALRPALIVERVKNCNRPGGPLDITEEDAEEILFKWKEAMEESWSEGWDNESAGKVQFVSFFDDTAVGGSTARMLNEITLDNSLLTAISIICIAVFSVLFLISSNWVESRVLITLVGVILVTIAFFAAVGFSILVGIKINVTIAWTLPFIMLGLGVDDLYIVLMAVKKQGGYTKKHFLKAMQEVIVPVSMTSIVNASMFAILNISDIPAIYLTARVADYCVIFLFIAIVFCFPAYLYLDMKRQAAGKRDVLFLMDAPSKDTAENSKENTHDFRSYWLYERFYEPLVLGNDPVIRVATHSIIWLIAAGLLGAGIYGTTQRNVGLGLEDFFPSKNQASAWAQQRTDSLASWSGAINWGELNYTNPDIQMKMIKQFENVVATPHVDDVETKSLWMADLLLWSSAHCTANFDREEFDGLRCGADMQYVDGTTCSATWVPNEYNLRQKIFSDFDDPQCYPSEGGICRPSARMHPADLEQLAQSNPSADDSAGFCPVADWSEDKFRWCLLQWRNVTGYNNFLADEPYGTETDCEGVYNTDHEIIWPIPYSRGPSLFVFDLSIHEDTTDMIEETRAVCDNDDELHCWMSGIGHEYWSQYIGIFDVLVELSGYSTLVGFGIAFVFLFAKFQHEGRHGTPTIFIGSLMGALLIAVTIILSLITVIGISILAGVNLTGFSNMSFVLSVGFAVEYSVHIVARWLRADTSHKGIERVRYTMSFLVLPTLMSFVSSTIGVICLAFTEFEFNQVFFFRPLIIVMFSTYFYGCWWLPAMLTLLDYDVFKLGKIVNEAADSSSTKSAPSKATGVIPEQPTVVPEQPVMFQEEGSVDLDDFDEKDIADALGESGEVEA